MCADPIAYSLARLDELNKKITRKQLESNAFISRHYLAPVKEKLHRLLASSQVDENRLLQEIASFSNADLMKAHATDMAVNPRQMSMSEMMALAENNGNAGDKNENGGEMKMPAGMPKVGKMPDWVKKRIEARKKPDRKERKMSFPKSRWKKKSFLSLCWRLNAL